MAQRRINLVLIIIKCHVQEIEEHLDFGITSGQRRFSTGSEYVTLHCRHIFSLVFTTDHRTLYCSLHIIICHRVCNIFLLTRNPRSLPAAGSWLPVERVPVVRVASVSQLVLISDPVLYPIGRSGSATAT